MPRRSKAKVAETPDAPKPRIRSAARMLYIFHQLVRVPEGRQLSELSKEIGVSDVTTLRLLQTLVYERLARKDAARGRYRLSPMFWLTALAAFPDVTEAQRELRAALARLARATETHAVLGVPYVGMHMIGLLFPTTPEACAPAFPLPAGNLPMHACAAGKCYLASLDDDELRAWCRQPLQKVTKHTCTRPQTLLKEVARTRERGYACDREESALGTWGLALPVADVTGGFAAGLQLCAPVATMSEKTIRQWLPPLQSVARSLSEAFSSLARLG